MKIRIFALARDLGLDSKVLIDLCEQAGVKLKLRNALATISEEERDAVVAYIRAKGAPSNALSAPAAAIAPVRDVPLVAGKVREIVGIPSRGAGRTQEELEEEIRDLELSDPGDTEPLVDSAVSVAESETPVAVAEHAVAEANSEEEAPDLSSEVESAEIENVTPVTLVDEPAAVISPPVATQSSDTMRRPRMVSQREMRPIGSVKDREHQAAAAGAKPSGPIKVNRDRQPGRPMVAAAPSLPTPTVKKSKPRDEKAQKPDMSLSEIVDRRSPLDVQLKALRKAKAEHDAGGPAPVDRKSRGAANKGSLLVELRQTRDLERQAKKQKRRKRSGPIDLRTTASISFPITVRALSEAIGRPAKSILSILFKAGRMVTINDELGEEESMEVAMELGVDLSFKRTRDIEAELLASLDHEDPPELMRQRPPMITILGHVDHGKTTMVDRIRSANVAGGEAGGITQHIAAYQVEYEGHHLTFVDTPGHAAFGEMRSRGADATDIVVLVVAADDGVMPQTVECISHAKNAGVPIVVALNKIDLPGIDEQRILQQLAQHELLPAEWGGEVEVVRTSGTTGKGIDKLLETLLLTAELQEFKANPDREGLGVCLESFRDEGRGAIAWLIVQKGTLRIGDNVLCGATYGRI
ncbi:MAG: translation initiation factor IF-2 N-terminal domain-containing protein, partial [Planctomycetota bacterium]|nr:translation initiation factor IF-2 N-terminal domain-containing protein [Planctomycetota bacterium]